MRWIHVALLILIIALLSAQERDPYESHTTEAIAPVSHGYSITPNDSNNLATYCRSVYVGVDGDLTVDLVGGDTVTFKNVVGGTFFEIRVKRVYATGTTATDLVCVY